MDYKALVAQFEANGGEITRCEEGARAMSNKDIARAIGYEPARKTKFLVYGIAEDGVPFTDHIFAADLGDAYGIFRERWPEARCEGGRTAYIGQA